MRVRSAHSFIIVPCIDLTIIRHHFRRFGVCESALPAAVLLALLVRPSCSTLEAALAALALVCFLLIAIMSYPLIVVRTSGLQGPADSRGV